MRTFISAIAFCGLTISTAANADATDIYDALKAVASSPDGEGIAQGMLEVGQTLNQMEVDDVIGFRNTLHLLGMSGQFQERSPEGRMLKSLWEQTTQRLQIICSVAPTAETVAKVDIVLGRQSTCESE